MTTPQNQPQTTEIPPAAWTAEAPAVHTAWAAVMAEVRAVGKTDRVTSGPAQFNFRGIDGVLNAVGPIFRKHGVYVAPIGVDILSTEHNPTRSGGMMKNVTISVTWRVTGPAGDSWMGISLGEGADAGDKAISKAHSVAYRTFLIQALALPTDEPDPDATTYERDQVRPPDYGPMLAEADAATSEAELTAIWAREDRSDVPKWVSDRFGRAIARVRAAASGDAQ